MVGFSRKITVTPLSRISMENSRRVMIKSSGNPGDSTPKKMISSTWGGTTFFWKKHNVKIYNVCNFGDKLRATQNKCRAKLLIQIIS